MKWRSAVPRPTLAAIMICNLFFVAPAFAADISGQVLGAGKPIAQSTVTLLAASAGAAQTTRTDQDRQRWPVRDQWHWHD